MSRPDAELIARLLEGRASPDERRAILERADADPEVLALLADAAALSESGAAAPAWRRALPSRANATMYAIAAVLVFALALPTVMRIRATVPPFDAAGLDAASVVVAAASGAPAPVMRGEGARTRLQLSAELGARATDFELLASAADTAAPGVARELAAGARMIPGGAAAAALLESAATGSAAARSDALRTLESLMDRPRFRAGRWAEATRLAAASNVDAFLRAPATRVAFDHIARSPELPPAARAAASRAARTLALEEAAPGIQQAVGELMTELAREPR